MNFLRRGANAFAALIFGCVVSTSHADEWRAFWVDAWGAGFRSQSEVNTLLGVVGDPNSKGRIREANLNSVIVQVRRRYDVCYPSGVGEPYMSGLSPSTFNALQAMINAAHDTTGGKKRIEVHCWLVTFATDGGQVYTQHIGTPTGSLTSFDNYWPTRDNNGVETADKAFDPGHPLVLQYVVNACMDMVNNFDIDGIHYDYIRFTANNQGYNPTSIARYNARYGLTGQPAPATEQFKQWRRDQVSSVVRQVYAKIQKSKPWVKQSGSFVTWNPSPTASTRAAFMNCRPYYDVYADWDSWLQEGIVDMAVPMTYYDWASLPNDYTKWMNFEKDRHGNRHMIIGPGVYLNTLSNAIHEIKLTRNPSPTGNYADGFCGYSYRVPYASGTWTGFTNSLVSQVTSNWADIPAMPWKVSPTTGHIMGRVTIGGTGAWADHTVMSVTGPVSRSMYVDGTGFYTFIDLPPGSYTVTASLGGYPDAQATVNVAVGVVTGNMYEQNFVLTSESPTITSQPQSQNVGLGSNATFTVTATGTPPLYYQWRFNSVSIGSATNSSYTRTNAQLSHAGNYTVVITNTLGSVTSQVAVLTVQVPPSITTQPQSTNVSSGQNAIFSVAASGTAPLSYQWRYNGANIGGATQSSLTLNNVVISQAGTYSVVVSNAAGTVTSDNATLNVIPPANVLWSLGGGSRPYLASSGQSERGMAYDPSNNRVLVVRRTSSETNIYVLNGDTGADLHTMNVNPSIINGGTFGLLMIGVADDGVVYGGNVTLNGSTTPFRLYRWNNDNASTPPTLAFSGNPSPGNAQRWGDTFDVRGSGTNTQILLGSRAGTNAAVLTTTDGTNFTASSINVSGIAPGNFGLGVAFGTNNTFWGKSTNMPLRQITFDLVAGTGSSIRSHTNFPTWIGPIGVSVPLNLLAGLAVENPDNLKLYDLTQSNTAPVLIATNTFATANANPFYVGSVDFGSNRVYALDPNNGLLAMQITNTSSIIPPNVTNQPQSQTVYVGDNATFSVTAAGTAPLAYQWQFNGSDITGATNSAYTQTNAQLSDDGDYTVVVSNSAGSDTSDVAVLTVLDVPPSIVTQPLSQTNNQNTVATFSAGATGTSLIYQWKKNDIYLTDNGHIMGVFTSTLTVSDVGPDDEAGYSVEIGNSSGSVTSIVATLTVIMPPQIGTHPASLTKNAGETATFTVADISGTPPFSYQWKKDGVDLSDDAYVSGATTPTLTVNNVLGNECEYTVVVSNVAGSDTSTAATLTVIDPIITMQPVSQTNYAGSNVVFTVAAYGTETLTYQWRKGTNNLANSGHVSGATTATLALSNISVPDEGSYSVVVTSGSNGTATSSNVLLEVVSELIAPTATIVNPKANLIYTNAIVGVNGTALDASGIEEVSYRVNGGTFIPANLSFVGIGKGSNWSGSITLTPGTNTFAVRAKDPSGNTTTVSNLFFYHTGSPFTLATNIVPFPSPEFYAINKVTILTGFMTTGAGTPSNGANLMVGRTYKLTATDTAPPFYILTNWTATWEGQVTPVVLQTNNLVLNFMMRSNMTVYANYITNPLVRYQGTYEGLFYESSGVNHHSSGLLANFRPTSKFTSSGKLYLDGDRITVNPKLRIDGTFSQYISRSKVAKPDLWFEGALDLAGGSDTLSGTISEVVGTTTNWTANLLADRRHWTTNAGEQAVQYTNAYTMVMQAFTNNADGPVGYCAWTMTVDKLGVVSASGYASDYSGKMMLIPVKTAVSKDGVWPFYAPMYLMPDKVVTNIVLGVPTPKTLSQAQGSMLGWLTFGVNTNSGTTNLAPQGEISWIKRRWTNLSYTAGFTNQAAVISSRHLLFATTSRIYNFTNADVVMSEGNVLSPFTNNVFLKTNNSFFVDSKTRTNGFTAALASKTGGISGMFNHVDTTNVLTPFVWTAWKGVMLQDYNYGRGFFVSSNGVHGLSGKTLLLPKN